MLGQTANFGMSLVGGTADGQKTENLCSFSSLEFLHANASHNGICTLSQPLFYQEGIPRPESPGAPWDMGDISCPLALSRWELQQQGQVLVLL